MSFTERQLNAARSCKRFQTDCSNIDERRTQSDYEPSSNINNIVKKYLRADYSPLDAHNQFMSAGKLKYSDFENQSTIIDSAQHLAMASTAFELLPAATRLDFENDYTRFFKYAADPRNRKEMVDKYGLTGFSDDLQPVQTEPVKVTENQSES